MNYFSKNKKWVAYLILLTFLFTSILPTNIGLAATSYTDAEQLQYEKQIEAVGGSLSYKGNAIADNYDVQVTKTVSPTGTENDFNIELKVVTSENVEALSTIKTGAAVVLVMDTSKSMQWDASGGGYCVLCQKDINDADAQNLHSCNQKNGDATYAKGVIDSNEADKPMRITTAVQVANSFLTEFAKFDTAMFSLVTFNADASAHQINGEYWLNVGKEDTEKNLTKVQTKIATLDDYYKENSAAERTPSVHSGTNIAGGLLVAYKLLTELGDNAPKHRYIIFLSDGAPNRGIENPSANVLDLGYTISGIKNGGDYGHAEDVADRVHDLSNVNVYSVGFSPDVFDSKTVKLLQYIASDPDSIYYDYASTPDELIADISEITTNVTKLAEAWQVTDSMGDYIQFLGFGHNANNLSQTLVNQENETYCSTSTVDNRTVIDWDLTKTGAVKNRDGTYTYSLTYQVRLDTTKAGFDSERFYDTNKNATLQYVVKNTNTGLYDGPYNVAFAKPKVKGYKGNLSFLKTDGKNPLPGAVFLLEANNCHEKDHSYSTKKTSTNTNNVNVTFTGIPSGHKYTLKEEAAPANYILPDVSSWNVSVDYGVAKIVDANNKEVTTIVNTPEKTEATVKKVWNDANNQDGKRPENLTVTLSNGTMVTLNEGNGWEVTVTDLPKYANGQEITYSWTEGNEAKDKGYTLTGTSKTGTVTTLTNSYTPEKTEATVMKVWNDANNQDGKRPTELKVTLSNGTEVTLNAANKWTATVTDLPKYAAGEKIEYTWTEGDMPEGYTLTGTSVDGTVTTLTNSYTPEETSATVKKVWDDANNQDGKRPPSLTVTLSNGTEVTLNEANEWTATVTNLPKYADGEEITYSWTESELPEGYELESNITEGKVTTITNKHVPETIDISGRKIWDDNNNQDGLRPEKIVVRLYADGVEVQHQEVEANTSIVAAFVSLLTDSENIWDYTFKGLPKYANGTEIVYTVTEDVVKNYTTSIEGFTITNKHEPEKTEATVKKVWDDADNQDGKRPESLTVTLSNGTEVTLNEGNGWEAKVENLPKYAGGEKIEYTWTEGDMPEGYTLTKTSVDGTVTTLTNSYTPEKTEATVKKVWDDADNQDGKRPAKLKVTLSDGTEVTLNKANGWTATVPDLPKYADGVEIEYTWTEENMPEGYTLTGTSKEGTVTTITNSHTPETIDVEGEKIWIDANNQDGIRPESIIVNLHANGSKDATRTMTVHPDTNGNWTYKFGNLPKYAGGELIEYTITENKVDGYTPTVNGYNITNTHEPAKTEATVKKVWNDADNQDGKRPESLTVTLSDGTEVNLNADNKWTATVEDLPKYKDGKEIIYSWTEGDMPEGYELTDTSVEGTVTTLTNSYTPETIEVSGTKTWIDGNNAEGTRPESITVNLFAGSEYVKSAEVTAADNWTYSFTELPKYADGKEINYTISENEVAGYDTTYSGTKGYDITNRITQKQVDVSGEKIWEVPADIELPVDEITVDLFRGDVKVDSTTASILNGWTYAFNGLDKYDSDGKAYVYTVKEATVVENFISKVVAVGNYLFDIINTYDRRGKIEVNVTKKWNDFNTNVTTHSAITVELYQNGVLYDTENLGEDGKWTMTFTNLPKYDANQEPFEYTIGEVPVNGYTTSIIEETDNSFVITNTLLLGKPGEITVAKQTTGDKKPADGTKFKFELQIQVVRPEGSNVLFDEAALLAEMDLGGAASALNDAIDELENSIGLVTTGSQYAYYLTEKDSVYADEQQTIMAVEYDSTTASAIVFEDGQGPIVTPVSVTTGSMYEWFINVSDRIVDEVMNLSNTYDANAVDRLLAELAKAVNMAEEDGYGFAMDYAAVCELITAARVYHALAGEVPEGLETTTPSALQVFQTMNGVTTQSMLYLVESDEDTDYYTVHFWLENGDMIKFDIQATSGSAISYRIVESLSDSRVIADYVGTDIFENGKKVTTGTSYGFVAYEEDGQMGYLFQNNYKNNSGGGGFIPQPPKKPEPPKDPEPPKKPEPPKDPEPSNNPELPKDPEDFIDDMDVPTGGADPDESLGEPEIPLGDAPATGDTNNAVPFMVLMMFALCGLAVTRRKFN